MTTNWINRSVLIVCLFDLAAVGTAPAFGQGADECGDAQAIAGDGIFDILTSNATVDGGPDCIQNVNDYNSDVWYVWTAPATGAATMETCGLVDWDSLLSAYMLQPCPPSQFIECNTDACDSIGSGEIASRISWPVVAGTTYLLRVGNLGGGDNGAFKIETTPFFGACCVPGEACFETTADDCTANGGTLLGNGSSCDDGLVCPLNAFTYQGRLNLAGTPLDGTADLEFRLWDAEAGGNEVGGVVAVDALTVSDGLFTADLNNNGEFGPNAFGGASRWLEIAVRSPAGAGGFTALAPRQPLTTTPYSTYAQTAANLGQTVFVNGGNVGIGTTAPTSELDVIGTVTATALVGDGSGLTNLPVMEGVWSENEADVYYDAGSVGVGTTTPTTALEVIGTVTATALVGDGSGLTNLPVMEGVWSENGADVYYDAGSVGIGTTTPTTALEVVGTVTATALVGDGSGLTNLPVMEGVWSENGADVYYDTGSVGIGESNPSAVLDVVGTTELNGDLTVDSDTLVVDGVSGNVGIGTATPTSTLDVAGPTRTEGIRLPSGFSADPAFVGTPGNYISFGHLGVSEDFIGYANNTFYFEDSVGGADGDGPNVVVGGKVGIGTTSPRSALDIAPAAGQGDIFGVDRIVGFNDLKFYVDNIGATEVMKIDQSGNVGIGVNYNDTDLAIRNRPGNVNMLHIEKSDGTAVLQVQIDGDIFAPELSSTPFGDNDLVISDSGLIQKAASSRRYKDNIEPYFDDFDLILQTELKQWTGKGDDSGRIGIGFIAEEIEEMGLTNLVLYDDEGKVQSLKFRNIPLYTLEVVKRHEREILTLRSVVNGLHAENDELSDAIAQMQTELSELRSQVGALSSLEQRMAEMEARQSEKAALSSNRN